MSKQHDRDFDRGTVRYLAAELEIPAQLAEAGGVRAAAAMDDLKKAHIAGGGMMRAIHVAEAQKHIAAIDPQKHPELLQHLQAVVLTLGGKPQRTELAHVTPGEIVIPAELHTPELMAALQAAAKVQGIDLSRFEVGNRRNSVNPWTGKEEFFDPSDTATLDQRKLCQLPDGRIVPYSELPLGYATVGAGGANTDMGVGVTAGHVIANSNQPTLPKPGGLAGGGKSGPVTSPASTVLRDVTGSARVNMPAPISRTISVGGGLAKTLPVIGTGMSLLDYLKTKDALENAPDCDPIT